jgi:osmotically-inducible protein OsmY
MKRLFALLLLPFVAFTLALPVSAASSKTTATQTQTEHLTDSQLETAIKNKLAKSKIGKDGLRFKVSKGVVTWEGTTAIPQHKGAATRMARTSGATQVINNIQVAGANSGAPLKKAYVQQ